MKDSNFNQLEGLKWLPWIGDNYPNLNLDDRLMIIGESHFHNTSPESIEQHDNPEYTKLVIKELAIDRLYYGTKIFPNLYLALFGKEVFDSRKLWNGLSYHNLIQRTLITNQERPSKADYLEGWKTFFRLLEKTQPKTILLLGTTSANTLELACKGSNFSTDGLIWEERIGKNFAKSAKILDSQGEVIELIFIKHPSKFFPWKPWNEYLYKRIPNTMQWLKENS